MGTVNIQSDCGQPIMVAIRDRKTGKIKGKKFLRPTPYDKNGVKIGEGLLHWFSSCNYDGQYELVVYVPSEDDPDRSKEKEIGYWDYN